MHKRLKLGVLSAICEHTRLVCILTNQDNRRIFLQIKYGVHMPQCVTMYIYMNTCSQFCLFHIHCCNKNASLCIVCCCCILWNTSSS